MAATASAQNDDRRRPGHQELRADGRRMLTLAEVAAHLNVTIDIVRKLIAANKLKARKLSVRNTRISERDLVAFMDS